MSIIDNGIGIYTGSVSVFEDPALYDSVYSLVSDDRRRSTDRKRMPADKRRSLAAEALLMRACSEYGVDYASAHFARNENGKPFFTDIPVYYNLSHSADRVMCAVSRSPVGCDVEKIRKVSDSIAARFYHPEEAALLDGIEDISERERLFFRIWTLKESFVKCIGDGFGIPFESFCVVPEENGWRVKTDIPGRYSLYEYDCGDSEYMYSYCSKEE